MLFPNTRFNTESLSIRQSHIEDSAKNGYFVTFDDDEFADLAAGNTIPMMYSPAAVIGIWQINS
ncbi:hypothetical protein [Pirellula sp. SH-Sr6A]|uniref:hypothetical protein n=1 Tax=Pirellula sp. SH-Sr6A TaxID=1632865 RepID=UPI00197BD02E|nr:hypothetical protein [Pirellula sp. SH-Sr6A]